jgi:hypothetical protein
VILNASAPHHLNLRRTMNHGVHALAKTTRRAPPRSEEAVKRYDSSGIIFPRGLVRPDPSAGASVDAGSVGGCDGGAAGLMGCAAIARRIRGLAISGAPGDAVSTQ